DPFGRSAGERGERHRHVRELEYRQRGHRIHAARAGAPAHGGDEQSVRGYAPAERQPAGDHQHGGGQPRHRRLHRHRGRHHQPVDREQQQRRRHLQRAQRRQPHRRAHRRGQQLHRDRAEPAHRRGNRWGNGRDGLRRDLQRAHRRHYGDYRHHGLRPAHQLHRDRGRRPEPHHPGGRREHHLYRPLGYDAHRRAHRRPGELHGDRWGLKDRPRNGRPDRDRRLHDHLLGAHRQPYGDHGHHGLESAEHLHRHAGRRVEPHHLGGRRHHNL